MLKPKNGASAKRVWTLEELQPVFQAASLALFARRPWRVLACIRWTGQTSVTFRKENKSELTGVQILGDS